MNAAVKTKPVAAKPAGANALSPQGCTNVKLRKLTREVSRHFDAEVGKSGLKTTQYSLLTYVMGLGPLRQVDLARGMSLDASTLTRNLRPLLEQGWIDVLPGPDARSRLVQITPAGRAKRTEAQRHWHAAQMKLNEILGNERVIALHALIDDVAAALKTDITENTDSGEADE